MAKPVKEEKVVKRSVKGKTFMRVNKFAIKVHEFSASAAACPRCMREADKRINDCAKCADLSPRADGVVPCVAEDKCPIATSVLYCKAHHEASLQFASLPVARTNNGSFKQSMIERILAEADARKTRELNKVMTVYQIKVGDYFRQ